MNKHLNWSIVLLLAILYFYNCSSKQNTTEMEVDFVHIKDGQFIKNGVPYYYVGTNFWYGAILASEGVGGDRERLARELDSLKAIGVDNLRILVGADGEGGVMSKVEPTLQTSPGVYNDTILAGLDYLLVEMAKRDMSAVLYLNNSWEWSGGYGQYLQWSGYGDVPIPALEGWAAYMNYVKQYMQCDSCKQMFADHVTNIISRKNRYTDIAYTDDPTIMSWQIGNEPRAFSDENKELFSLWIKDVATLIKSIDKNHLVSTGSEGSKGSEGDIALWEEIHTYPEVDYMTIHIWPYNWGWADKDNLGGTIDVSINNTIDYITEHVEIARKLQKPLVIEEFGLIRDDFKFGIGTPTTYRDRYYKVVFDKVLESKQNKDYLAGCNFWAWGGFAKQNKKHEFWQKGDDYMGDPAQEQQGLYSVFYSDSSTLDLIKNSNSLLITQ